MTLCILFLRRFFPQLAFGHHGLPSITFCAAASAPFLDFMNDISDFDDLHCLVVQAQNDFVIDAFATEAATKRFWEMLPPKTMQHTIQGGTHSGFGSYVGTWKPEVEGIPEEEQQKEAVQMTIDFLEH